MDEQIHVACAYGLRKVQPMKINSKFTTTYCAFLRRAKRKT